MQNESKTQQPLNEVWNARDLLPKGRLEAFADGLLAIVLAFRQGSRPCLGHLKVVEL